jgi:chromosome segregation ATPase
MSIRDDLIGKLSDSMDEENAATFVADAIDEALTAERQARDQAEQIAAAKQETFERLLAQVESALVTMRARADQAEQERDRLRKALRKVRAHTSHLPGAPDTLLADLLASVERITDAALSPQDGQP